LTLGERIRQIEVEGYLVLPDLLDAAHLARLKREVNELPLTAVDYSPHQRTSPGIQFRGGDITQLIAHPPTIAFLRELFGGEIVMMSLASPGRNRDIRASVFTPPGIDPSRWDRG